MKSGKYIKYEWATVAHTSCLEIVWADPRIFTDRRREDVPQFIASNGWMIRQHSLVADPVNRIDAEKRILTLAGPADSGRLRHIDCRINAVAEQVSFELDTALTEFNEHMEVFHGRYRRNLRWIDRRKKTETDK